MKEVPELAGYMKGQTQSVISIIKRNLRFEIAFAFLFLIFDFLMLIFFADELFLSLFSILLLVFCVFFISYLVRLLQFTRTRYSLDTTVKDQLAKYIYIISRFTKLYFQLTIVLIPLMLVMGLIALYLDRDMSGNFIIVSDSQTILAYLGTATAWSVMMYFIAKWYIKKLYGNHLTELKEQLRELQEVA